MTEVMHAGSTSGKSDRKEGDAPTTGLDVSGGTKIGCRGGTPLAAAAAAAAASAAALSAAALSAAALSEAALAADSPLRAANSAATRDLSCFVSSARRASVLSDEPEGSGMIGRVL